VITQLKKNLLKKERKFTTPDKLRKNINNGLTMLTETTLPSINVQLNP
jgi:hypothetical protein